MTDLDKVLEISNLFDIKLGKFASDKWDVTEYTKSIYLSLAQESFISAVLGIYETDDKVRHVLKPLLLTSVVTHGQFTHQTSTSFEVPAVDNIMSIVYEELNGLEGAGVIQVIPLSQNDVRGTLDNPFRTPDTKIAYRITEDGTSKIMYNGADIESYTYIACRKPSPIVLEDLPDNLSVFGVRTVSVSELDIDSIYKIIDLAVGLYIKDRSMIAPQVQPAAQAK